MNFVESNTARDLLIAIVLTNRPILELCAEEAVLALFFFQIFRHYASLRFFCFADGQDLSCPVRPIERYNAGSAPRIEERCDGSLVGGLAMQTGWFNGADGLFNAFSPLVILPP